MREYLKKLREDHGLTQQAVADYLGIAQHYYGYIENGERQKEMKLTTLGSLASLFSVPLSSLVENEMDYKRNAP